MYIAPMQEVGHAPHAVQARDAEGHDEVDFGGPDGQLTHKSFKIQNAELKGDEPLSVFHDTLSTWQLNLHYYSLNVNLPLPVKGI